MSITREDFIRQGGSEAEKAQLRQEWDADRIAELEADRDHQDGTLLMQSRRIEADAARITELKAEVRRLTDELARFELILDYDHGAPFDVYRKRDDDG